jgi:hypothetical protein
MPFHILTAESLFLSLFFSSAPLQATEVRVRKLRETKAWLANLITVTLSASTLVVIVVATLVSQSLVKSGEGRQTFFSIRSIPPSSP